MIASDGPPIHLSHVAAYRMQITSAEEIRRVVPAIVLVHVCEGSIEVRGPDASVAATTGETLLCRPGIAYAFSASRRDEAETGGEPAQCLFTEVMFSLDGHTDPLIWLDMPVLIKSSEGAGLADAMQELVELPDSLHMKRLERQARRAELGHAVLGVVFRVSNVKAGIPEQGSEETVLQRVINHCRSHLSASISVDDMIKISHMSRSAFFGYLKRSVGVTPAGLLKKLRLEKSLELLRVLDNSVAQVADAVGFAHQFHFAREFRKAYGITPSQYQKTHTLTEGRPRPASDADELFDRMDYEAAAAEYGRVAEKLRGAASAKDAMYRKGLSLYLAGDMEAAFGVWENVKGARYERSVGLRRCRFLFDRGRHSEAIEKLGVLCADAEGPERSEALHMWSGLVDDLCKYDAAGAVNDYLDLRKRLFPRESGVNLSAADGSLLTGRYRELLETCPDRESQCMLALRCMGRYKELLSGYGDNQKRRALTSALRESGRPKEVLKRFGDISEACVFSLVDLGRAEEALELYPDRCVTALLSLGRYEEVLTRFPHDVPSCIHALVGLGRGAEALERAAGYEWVRYYTLLLLDRAEEVCDAGVGQSFQLHLVATAAAAIEGLGAGGGDGGLEKLNSLPVISSREYAWGYVQYVLPLIVPLVNLFSGDEDLYESRIREIIDGHRYCYGQRLWHDARFVEAEIDEKKYLSQPFRLGSDRRLLFLRAIQADRQGKKKKAVKQYSALPDFNFNSMDELIIGKFVQWRLRALQKSQ